MKTALVMAAFESLLFFPTTMHAQEESVMNEPALFKDASAALASVDASRTQWSGISDFSSFNTGLQDLHDQLPELAPQARFSAMRAASLNLSSKARTAEKSSGQTSPALDQGLADLDNAVGNWQDAKGFARRILQAHPQSSAAWLSISQADLGLELAQEALFAAKQSAALAPRNSFAWRNEAMAYAALGKKDLAVTAARQALALNPSDRDSSALWQVLHENNSHFHLGQIATNWDNPSAGSSPVGSATPRVAKRPIIFPAATEAMSQVEKIESPASHVAPAASSLLQDAANKIAVADYDAALADAAKAAAINPQNGAAYYYLAAVDNKRGQYQSAIEKATQGLRADPDDILLRDERAWAFNHLGQVRDAAADSNSALENDPKDPYAYANLSQSNEQKGDIRSALADLEQAAAINPSFIASYQMALRRYGLAGVGSQEILRQQQNHPQPDRGEISFLVILACSMAGGTLIAAGIKSL